MIYADEDTQNVSCDRNGQQIDGASYATAEY